MSTQDLANLATQPSKTFLPYEKLLYQLIENTPAAIALLDREMRYLQVSQRWLSDYGLSHQNIIGKLHYEVCGDFPVRWQEIYRHCQTGAVERWEEELPQPQLGTTQLIKWEARLWSVGVSQQSDEEEIEGLLLFAQRIASGNPANTGMGVTQAALRQSEAEVELQKAKQELEIRVLERTARLSRANKQLEREIADRRRAEAELRASEQKLSLLFQQTQLAVIEWSANLEVTAWNPAAAAIFGYSSVEAIGSHVLELIVPASAKAQMNQVVSNLLVQTGGTRSVNENITKDGKIIICDWYNTPLIDSNGVLVGIASLVLDVTEHKLAEQAQARLTAILEATTDFVAIADEQGHAIYINSAGRQMLGLSEDFDITSTFIEDYYPWSANQLIQQVVLSTAIREGVWNGETAFQYGDGPVVPVSQVLIAHKSASGKVEFFSTIARDISDRKRAEEEQQKLIALIEGSSEFIGLATLAGQAIYLNEAGQKLVGLDGMDAVRQTSIPEYFTPEDLDDFLKHILPVVLEKGRWEGEFRFRHFQTGVAIPVYYNFFTIKDRQTRQPIAVAAVTRDITEQKRFIEALRQSEAQLRQQVQREQLRGSLTSQIRNSLDLDTVLETAIQEIRRLLQIDRCQFAWYFPDGDPPYWNVVKEAHEAGLPDFTGRYEASALEPVASQLLQLEILRIDDIETAENSVWRQFIRDRGIASLLVLPIQTHSGAISLISCIHSNETRPWGDAEVELLSAVTDQLAIAINQAELYAQTHEAAVRAQEQATQIAATLRELQRTQAQLIQSEKMSSLGQLVAGVAHEINNPVNFIYGNLIHASEYVQHLLNLVELYQQEYPNPTSAIFSEIEDIDLTFLRQDLPKLLSSMKVGAERIREIVHSLRTFSRIDEAERKAVNIHEGIDSTLMILQNRLKAKPDRPGIEVVKVYGNLPLVECYPGQLNQVFMNLLSNAIDALEDRGSQEDLRIQNPQIWIRTSAIDKSRVVIAIADNGPGMTEEVRQHLFDPFFTTKPVGKGTGLGLSISYQIVREKHNGYLKCFSTPGQGAEFVIEIPI